MRSADVIVIGAGVLGTFHAYFAARKGCHVLLIERNALPGDASARNFGIPAHTIVAPGTSWDSCTRASAEIYRAIQRERDIGVRETGTLYLASTELEHAVLREFTERAPEGYRCAYFGADEALARYPFVRADYCAGALLCPDDLTLEPREMMSRLIPYIVEQGNVEYVSQTTVVSVASTGTACTVKDARGETYTSGRVIVCSGAEYRLLFPDLLRTSGLRLCKLQMLRTAPVAPSYLPHAILSGLSIRRYPAFALCPSLELLKAEPIDARLDAYGIHLLFKQSIDGSIVIGDSHEYRDLSDAATLEESTNPAINAAILAYGQSMLELPSWTIQQMWNGYYLTHPEREVYTETIAGTIHIVTGTGKGMTLGPGFARQHIDTIIT